jgi:hypothetical protein
VKLLLVVIDAASPRVFCPAVQTGRLPNMKRLADAGEMHQASATIFPSITPAATSSIITGTYPAEHGIAGASWFDEARQEVAYYGDDFWVIAKEGFGAFLRDFLVRLNGDRLTAPTLFELVERTGRPAACLNYLVYRGLATHRVNVPWLLSLVPGVPFTETVNGPSVLCLGDFVTTRTPRSRKKLEGKGGLLHRLGMDDASTAALLAELAEDRALPDFTVAYFADNDYVSHEVGPHAALPVIERVDAALGAAFDAAGGFDAFMRDTCVIVTSDHGHCEILADAAAVIPLDRILADFTQATLGRPWQEGDEIMICPNMRAAQLYMRVPGAVLVDRIAETAMRDERIDLAMWRRQLVEADAPGYRVVSQRGRLDFWRGSDGPSRGVDAVGTEWSWNGDLAALQYERDGRDVASSEYPNAFERIAGALDARNSGEIWLTARPGCEFEVPGGKAHTGGASHGALHALDSLSPVILAGAPLRLPSAMRSIDIAPLCMEILGIPMRYRISEPRYGNSQRDTYADSQIPTS